MTPRLRRGLLLGAAVVALVTAVVVVVEVTRSSPPVVASTTTGAPRATTTTQPAPVPPASLSVSLWGDSMAVEIMPFLRGALNQQSTTAISFRSETFPGISVCNYVNAGDMEVDATTNRPQVVAFEFSGDVFSACSIRLGKGRPIADYAQTSADDMKAAIEIYLQKDPSIAHLEVLLPPPSVPDTNQAYIDLVVRDYQIMVFSLQDPRVTISSDPAASVSNPDGSFTWTLPSTIQEPAAGVCLGAGGVNTVRSSTGHFCVPESCVGFQPGAWRFSNAMAKDMLDPYGIIVETTTASGYLH